MKPIAIIPHDGIFTFADCPEREEEIIPNDSYLNAGILDFTCDPWLLDWSGCRKGGACESLRSEGKCPRGFV
jgi:hypothetical protein